MWPWRVVRRRLESYVRALARPEIEGRVLHEIEGLRRDIALARSETEGRMRREMEDLRGSVERLELALTEHPDFVSGSDVPSASSPFISVIMPTWNRARILGAAIRSVQAQQFTNWELLVLDDGSTDDTADVVASFAGDPRIRYIKLAHGGHCAARNHGHSIAKGELIAYLDSDNLWYPQYLWVAAEVFRQHADVDLAYGALVSGSHGQRILFEPFDRERLEVANFIDTSVFIHRRSLVDRFGGFDDKLASLVDWDIILRYTAHAPAYRLPVLAARYREMDDIRVSATAKYQRSIQQIRDKWKSNG